MGNRVLEQLIGNKKSTTTTITENISIESDNESINELLEDMTFYPRSDDIECEVDDSASHSSVSSEFEEDSYSISSLSSPQQPTSPTLFQTHVPAMNHYYHNLNPFALWYGQYNFIINNPTYSPIQYPSMHTNASIHQCPTVQEYLVESRHLSFDFNTYPRKNLVQPWLPNIDLRENKQASSEFKMYLVSICNRLGLHRFSRREQEELVAKVLERERAMLQDILTLY